MVHHRWRRTWFKITRMEYWPSWAYYAPVWIQHIGLSMSTGNPFFFLRTNPGINGFILSDSKYETLGLVPTSHRPQSILIAPGDSWPDVKTKIKAAQLDYPLILKPDIGFRGIRVSLINTASELQQKLQSIGVPYIIQEYVEGPLELGIFYYRNPQHSKGHFPSITLKQYLEVKGDGGRTLEELVYHNPRAFMVADALQKTFKDQWNQVLPHGENLLLGCIGNHNLGTKFTNGKHLLNAEHLAQIDKVAQSIPGVYFGRFDIKTQSLDALKQGDFKILEINGVGGEPTHIYDPNASAAMVFGDLCKVWRIAAQIAKVNMKHAGRPGFKEAYTKWRAFAQYRKKLLMEPI